ncbi:MAG: hypothetical protein KDN22_11975 [Verrucomicrobiae bacterium]|nr:hypothetical protein [Verrucomicrobiae bacterium]
MHVQWAILAENAPLTEPEQAYLLAIVRKLQGFSSDTSAVLVALAKNQATTDATRAEIALLATELSLFSSDASRVTAALAETR